MSDINFFELESEKYWSFPVNQRKQAHEEIRKMILSGDYLGSRKIDGHYFRFVKGLDGCMALQSRSRGVSGNFTDKLANVPHLHPFFEALPFGTCLLGELYLPKQEKSSAVTRVINCSPQKSVCLQENARNRLCYYVFDIWQWCGNSLLETHADARFALVETMAHDRRYTSKYVSFAKYYDGESLLRHLSEVLFYGGEGVVLTLKNSVPSPGKRVKLKTVKVKRRLRDTIDVVVMGANPPNRVYEGKAPETWPYWENGIPVTKSYHLGIPGSLQIGAMKDGELVLIGSLSGLEEKVLQDWKNYVGRVCEITCMEVHETGGLRHPRFVGWRDDLSASDCEYSKIYG